MTTIRIWVYDGILASGVAGPIDIFTAANSIGRPKATGARATTPPITWRIESLDGQPVQTASGQPVAVDGKIDARRPADAVFLAAPFVADMDTFVRRRDLLQALSSALRRQHEAGAVLASYCTGSYVFAEAGLLDGRMATTHWAKATEFTRRYPKVELRAHEILTEQDRILCSGAVTSSLILALRLVALFAGADVAARTAKMLLIDTNRVSQASYASLLDENGHADALVAQAQRRMEATLQHGFSLSKLATHLAVSERTLNRRFKQAVGNAPLGYLQTLRVEVAKRLLESGRFSVDVVGARVGYGDLSTFRQLFKRKTGLSPRDYQRHFAQASPPSIGNREQPAHQRAGRRHGA